MKLIDKYYNKLYKQTLKVTKKLFGKDVTESLVLRNSLRKELEEQTGKLIDEITGEDVVGKKIGYKYAKYRTLSKILEVLESACVLKTFTIEEFENECC